MKKTIFLSLVSLFSVSFLASCSKGGGENPKPEPTSTTYNFVYYDGHSIDVEVPEGKDVKDYYPENTPKHDDGYNEYTYTWEYKQSHEYQEKQNASKISTTYYFEYIDGRPTKTVEVPRGGSVEDFFPTDHSAVFYDYEHKIKHTYTSWSPKTLYTYIEVGDETNLCKIDYEMPESAVNPPENLTWMEEGSSISLKNASQEGYTFDGWYDAITGGNKVNEINNISKDETLYARFTPITYSIIYDLDDGVNDPNNPDSFTIEDSKQLNDASKTGYTFVGWYEDSAFETPITIIEKRHENLHLYAKFAVIPYGITYHLDGGVNPSGNPSTYTVNEEVTFLSASKDGYTFNGWFNKETGGTQVLKIEQGTIGNIELWAKFTMATYTISYELYGGYSSNPTSYQIITEDITLQDAYGKDGYTFEGWYKDSGFSDRIEVIPKGSFGDLTLYAHFVANKYNSAFNLNGGYTSLKVNYIVNQDPSKNKSIEVKSNSSVNVYDYRPSNTNYYFGGWYSDPELTEIVSEDVSFFSETNIYGKFLPRSELEDYDFLTIGDNEHSLDYYDHSAYSIDYYVYCPYYFKQTATFALELWAGLLQNDNYKKTTAKITDVTNGETLVSGTATNDVIKRPSSTKNIIPGHLYQVHFEFASGYLKEWSFCRAIAWIKTTINPALFTFDGICQQTYDAQTILPLVDKDDGTFAGWEDEDGQMYTPGIWKFTEEKTFTAIWQ